MEQAWPRVRKPTHAAVSMLIQRLCGQNVQTEDLQQVQQSGTGEKIIEQLPNKPSVVNCQKWIKLEARCVRLCECGLFRAVFRSILNPFYISSIRCFT